jgi:hypothetical protein
VSFFSKKQKNIKNENGNIVNNIPKKILKNHQIWGKKKREGILLNYYYFVKFGLRFSFGIIFRTIFFFKKLFKQVFKSYFHLKLNPSSDGSQMTQHQKMKKYITEQTLNPDGLMGK